MDGDGVVRATEAQSATEAQTSPFTTCRWLRWLLYLDLGGGEHNVKCPIQAIDSAERFRPGPRHRPRSCPLDEMVAYTSGGSSTAPRLEPGTRVRAAAWLPGVSCPLSVH
jgi:hypothetical protein